jgi:hypothetical protein
MLQKKMLIKTKDYMTYNKLILQSWVDWILLKQQCQLKNNLKMILPMLMQN